MLVLVLVITEHDMGEGPEGLAHLGLGGFQVSLAVNMIRFQLLLFRAPSRNTRNTRSPANAPTYTHAQGLRVMARGRLTQAWRLPADLVTLS